MSPHCLHWAHNIKQLFLLCFIFTYQFSSVAQLCLTLHDPWTHGPQHARPPCPSLTPGVYSNSSPLSQWWLPTISSSVIPFSCPQSFLASGSFQMSQLFASGGQSIGVSASTSVLPMNTQDWFPLGWTGWISLQSKGLSRVFSNTIVQKHQLMNWFLLILPIFTWHYKYMNLFLYWLSSPWIEISSGRNCFLHCCIPRA